MNRIYRKLPLILKLPNFRQFTTKNLNSKTFSEYISNQSAQFHSVMVKCRAVSIRTPIFWRERPLVFNFTLSNLAGHASFIALALSYLESDFLSLRLYAATGISMSIIFQYYRAIPLWIPIRWNTLFLLINAIMITLLLIEENEALNLPSDETDFLREVFTKYGHLKPVDIRQLISHAKKQKIKAGEALITQGVENTYVHLVKSGKLGLRRDGKDQGVICKSQLVGVMSFLSWEETVGAKLSAKKKIRDRLWNISSFESDIRLMLNEELTHFEELLSSSQSGAKLEKISNRRSFKHSFIGPDGSIFEEELPEGELGLVSVICMEDTEVYSWSFHDIHDLVASHPSIGIVFEKTIAADLHAKMVGTWRHEPSVVYKELLSGILIDNEITDAKREMLDKFRETNCISKEDHASMLKEHGWSLEEYDVGVRGGPSKNCLCGYEKQLEKFTLNGHVSEYSKTLLREQRQREHISGETHLRLLHKIGWTIDEYEVGRKNVVDSSVKDTPSSSAKTSSGYGFPGLSLLTSLLPWSKKVTAIQLVASDSKPLEIRVASIQGDGSMSIADDVVTTV